MLAWAVRLVLQALVRLWFNIFVCWLAQPYKLHESGDQVVMEQHVGHVCQLDVEDSAVSKFCIALDARIIVNSSAT